MLIIGLPRGAGGRGNRSVTAWALQQLGVAMSDQQPRELESVSGVVKWFDPRKGYGFIVGPEGQDIFAHYTVIEGDGFRALRDGSKVIYDAVSSDRGWKATRIIRDPEEAEPAEIVVKRRTHSRSPRR